MQKMLPKKSLQNVRKRLVKSPKVYWRDTGLLHALPNLVRGRDLLDQPWVGASWEGFVIEQILGSLAYRGLLHDAFYLRTGDQYEIDLVLEVPAGLLAVEVKLTSSPGPGDMERLNKAADLIDASKRILVSQVPQSTDSGRLVSGNLPWLLKHLGEIAV